MNTVTIEPNPDRPSLFDAQAQRDLTLQERFVVFHLSNPQVFTELERMTQQMVNRGRTRLSMKCLVEVLRWSYYLTTSDPESEFKVNNSFTSLYTRLMIDVHPEWTNLFQLREIHEGSAFLVRKR